MAAYATPSDLIARYDSRTIGDLASDSGESIPEDSLAESTVVLQALEDASGRVDAAVGVASQYSTDDLASLTGNTASLLKRIVCELAFVFLMERRANRVGDERLQQAKSSAEAYIVSLRNGERIFGVPGNIAASVVDTDGPTAFEYMDLNLIPDRVNHYYPQRKSRLPLGR